MNSATTLRNLSISRLARLALFTAVATFTAGACGKKKEEVVVPEPEPAPPPPEPVVEAPKRVYQDPPAATAPRPVQFPDLQSFTTKNGLQVFVVENHEVPLVSVQLVVRAGTMDDRQLAEMTAAMLGEGTKKRKKAQIDEAIEYVGASLSAGAGVHETYVSTRVLRRDLELALDLIADELQNPAFPEDALTKLKEKAKTGLKAMKSDPGELADTLFDMVAYPSGHPYGRPLPTDAEIDAVTLDGVKRFHDTFYRSNNAFLVLSGDITIPDAEPLVTKHLGKWKHIDGAAPPNPLNAFKQENYQHPSKLVVHLVDRPASAQSEVRVGNLALARRHPDWIKMDLTSTILGGGSTGRLFLDVREDKGLTYGIYSRMSAGQAPGTWLIWTKTKTKTTGEMLTAIFGHIARMRDEAPTGKEFEDAVQQTVGAFPLQIETAEQIASRVKTIVTYGLAADYYKTYRDEVLKVQIGDIQAMARAHMRATPHVVIVGTAKKVEEQIKEALPGAEIVLYDTDLNRIQK